MLRSVVRSFSYKLPGEVVPVSTSSVVKCFISPAEAYKPSETLEFDRNGETLVYSSESYKKFSVFFPMPWSLGTWSAPVVIGLIAGGHIAFSWKILAGIYLSILPHCHHLYNLRFHVDKVWYVRGGLWKVQNSGVMGLVSKSITGPDNLNIVKGESALTEDGKLAEDITLKAETWYEYLEDVENQELIILKSGTVHNPEIFQAMLNKMRINDSNFVINLNPENSPVSKKCIGN